MNIEKRKLLLRLLVLLFAIGCVIYGETFSYAIPAIIEAVILITLIIYIFCDMNKKE